MVPEVTGAIFRQFFAKIPAWLICYFYGPDKIAKLIDIDLRSNCPINFNLNADVPEISLYFYFNNRSPFDLILDRLLIELWIGQPVLNGVVLRRYVIPKGEWRDNIYFSCSLTSQQQNQIKKSCNGQLLSASISFSITVYLESKIGMVSVDKQIQRSDVPCKY